MLELSWLGSPIAEIDGAQIHFETRKVFALLAYLSLNPNPIPREKLAALFWPEADQSHALANLRRALGSLLHCLPAGYILADRETIRWIESSPVRIDVTEIHSYLSKVRGHLHAGVHTCSSCLLILEATVKIYRGEFLEGMNLPDCPGFDDWQYDMREELKRELAWVLGQLTLGWSNQAAWDKALRAARSWISLDRLGVEAQLALVDIYIRTGRRIPAQRQFEEYTQLIKTELGQSLDGETIKLFQAHLNPTQPVKPETRSGDLQAALVSPRLLKSKLYLPSFRTNRIIRARLLSKLDKIFSFKLTLVSAPAGFGKTSLLVDWIVRSNKLVSWLSLDKGDNDPVSFFTYICAAIDGVVEGACDNTQAMLEALQLPDPGSYTSVLLNDLEKIAQPIVLVLDDYQFITNHSIHDACTYLLERAPKNLHLVIASRADPPLPLARLRTQAELLEIRVDDLRFTISESETFFHQVMQLDVPAKDILTLSERTEGWAVGLQMAALSMRDREDLSSFIKGFSGTNRYILDYLLEEVLAGQSQDIQRFLLCTSILDTFTAPLCDALLAASVSTMAEYVYPGSNEDSRGLSASALDYLDRANLFLVPLDDEHAWYRYHHLFADLLRARLSQLHPALLPRLHLAAAEWLGQHGQTIDSLTHYLAAGEYIRAAHLVEENTTRLLAQGEVNALMGWIEVLPADLRLARPRLSIHQAYVFILGGRLAEVPPLLDQVETILDASARHPGIHPADDKAEIHPIQTSDTEYISPSERVYYSGAIAAIRACRGAILGLCPEAVSFAREALRLLPPENLWDRAAAGWALGFALHMQGNLAEARAAFEEQVSLGRKMSSVATVMIALPDLSWLMRDQGKIAQARTLLEAALADASQKGARTLGFVARNKATLAALLYEQNDLEATHAMLLEALDLARYWPNPSHLPFTYVFLARVLLAKGDLPGARQAIGEAERLRMDAGLTRMIRRMVEVNLVRVWLAIHAAGVSLAVEDPFDDQVDTLVADWRSELDGITESEVELMDDSTEEAMLSLARLAIATGKEDEAASSLELLVERTRTAGHINQLISALVLSAPLRWARSVHQAGVADRKTGQKSNCAAFTQLDEALELAQSGGYVRIFLDEGQPMKILLAEWLHQPSDGHLLEYANMLLTQFQAEGEHVVKKLENHSRTEVLVEPLTPREVEVLQLICAGDSNQSIADKLFISLQTVKKHTGNIFGKLGVTSRAQAMVKGHQLGLFLKDS